MMEKWFKEKTVGFRHWIVRQIAPKLYSFTFDVMAKTFATPRPMILFVKDYLKGHWLVGVEIGVAQAQNALSILQELPMEKLFLIDPYVAYMENGQQLSYVDCYEVAKQKLAGLKQVTFLHESSEQAVGHIDEGLDFVYIDGNHSYKYVKMDILNYFPKVRVGGVIGGHDYVPFHADNVVRAVDEFVSEHGRENFHTLFPDWWFVKQ
jgi:hypothetical protein